MKQFIQNKRTGVLRIDDLDAPTLRKGMILVKNYFSVISAGTEKTTIRSRKASLLARAKSQPEELKKVLDEVKRNGLFRTYSRVMSKLESSASLGYSTAGIVLAVDPEIQDIEVGDRAACAGAEYAFHSDTGEKGHRTEIVEFMQAVRSVRSEIIPIESIIATSHTTFKILESLNSKEVVTL